MQTPPRIRLQSLTNTLTAISPRFSLAFPFPLPFPLSSLRTQQAVVCVCVRVIVHKIYWRFGGRRENWTFRGGREGGLHFHFSLPMAVFLAVDKAFIILCHFFQYLLCYYVFVMSSSCCCQQDNSNNSKDSNNNETLVTGWRWNWKNCINRWLSAYVCVCIGRGVGEPHCHGKFRLAHKLINFVFASFLFAVSRDWGVGECGVVGLSKFCLMRSP